MWFRLRRCADSAGSGSGREDPLPVAPARSRSYLRTVSKLSRAPIRETSACLLMADSRLSPTNGARAGAPVV